MIMQTLGRNMIKDGKSWILLKIISARWQNNLPFTAGKSGRLAEIRLHLSKTIR